MSTTSLRYNGGYYALAVLMVFATDSMIVATNVKSTFKIISYLAIIMLFIVMTSGVIRKKPMRISKEVGCAVLVSILLAMSMVLHSDYIVGYVMKGVLLLTGTLLAEEISFKKISECYIDVIAILAAVSLGVFLGTPIIRQLSFIPTVVNQANNEYKNLLLCVVQMHKTSLRNYGIFWEPGVYQAYLNIALFLMYICRINRKGDDKRTVIILLALLTTKSATGYIVLLILFGTILIDNHRITKRKKLLLILFCFLGGLVVVIGRPSILYEIIAKFARGTGTDSFTPRIMPILAHVNAMKEAPFLGIGASNLEEYSKQIMQSMYSMQLVSATNTLTMTGAMFGVPVMVFYLIQIYRFCLIHTHTGVGKWMVFVFFIAILSAEPLMYSFFFTVLFCFSKRKT